MDDMAELCQQLADALNERELLAKGIAEAACKLGITSEGVALTGPHLLTLLGDMVGFAADKPTAVPGTHNSLSPPGGEPDFKSDKNALEIFSKLMAHKLARSAANGRSGWQQCSQEALSRMLREHVEKGDPVDVANFCMMLCANGFSISKLPAADREPDETLCKFYEVDSYPDLVRELVDHVSQLQDSARRNVKPWEDTFPPTLLPAYIARITAEDANTRLATAKVVLPERLDLPHRDEFESADQYAAAVGETKKWNACLDEVASLNGLPA